MPICISKSIRKPSRRSLLRIQGLRYSESFGLQKAVVFKKPNRGRYVINANMMNFSNASNQIWCKLRWATNSSSSFRVLETMARWAISRSNTWPPLGTRSLQTTDKFQIIFTIPRHLTESELPRRSTGSHHFEKVWQPCTRLTVLAIVTTRSHIYTVVPSTSSTTAWATARFFWKARARRSKNSRTDLTPRIWIWATKTVPWNLSFQVIPILKCQTAWIYSGIRAVPLFWKEAASNLTAICWIASLPLRKTRSITTSTRASFPKLLNLMTSSSRARDPSPIRTRTSYQMMASVASTSKQSAMRFLMATTPNQFVLAAKILNKRISNTGLIPTTRGHLEETQ